MKKEIKKGHIIYINGRGGTHTIPLVFEKEAAKHFAQGLLEAANSAMDVVQSVGLEIDAYLQPKNKVMVLDGGIDYEGKEEKKKEEVVH